MTALTLYEIEDNLAALVNTEDMVEDPEQRKAIEAEIVTAQLTAAYKRDSFGKFLATCEHYSEALSAEIKVLQARKKRFESAKERAEGYAVYAMQALGRTKLEGNTVTLALRKCPESTAVSDEASVPSQFKTLTITVPALAWEELIDGVDIDERSKFIGAVKKTECTVDRTGIKASIKGGVEVPGASLVSDKYSLIRK
jgi:Siphovirus Gp157